ncbi:metal cation transporter [Candidatus Protofrankia californiensis]|uniref:Metal cation transporter n=1 Tax=Candidatus Protofrankia californiensis TaxID=1839754 RepID=A0A1C3PAS8_9ACTN|nr:metal cation transporter [Candidatus Protofrankia californiensis]
MPAEPITVGVTSSTGIQTTKEIAAAVETPGVTGRSILGYGIIGFLVGVLPIVLGLAWLPSLRRADARWTSAFLALTAGLLTFVAFDALGEAFELQAGLPTSLHGTGLVLLGVAVSSLALTFVTARLSGRTGASTSGSALATLVAIGIGLHNLGEGLAIGSSFAIGELVLGTFLIVGFMIHNIAEGLGIAAPLAEQSKVKAPQLAGLALVAGAPAIAGTWIGGFLVNDILGAPFMSIAVGAALQVVVGIVRHLARRAPGGLGTGHVLGGFLAGVAVMYTTGLLTG